MTADFYSLIESFADKSDGLKSNLIALLDNLLQRGELDPSLSAKLASLRAKVAIELSELS